MAEAFHSALPGAVSHMVTTKEAKKPAIAIVVVVRMYSSRPDRRCLVVLAATVCGLVERTSAAVHAADHFFLKRSGAEPDKRSANSLKSVSSENQMIAVYHLGPPFDPEDEQNVG
jgi:hypothetical protein